MIDSHSKDYDIWFARPTTYELQHDRPRKRRWRLRGGNSREMKQARLIHFGDPNRLQNIRHQYCPDARP